MQRQSRWTVRTTFFFFQAEDGIRDRDVTGVQTCALPILGIEVLRALYSDVYEHAFALDSIVRQNLQSEQGTVNEKTSRSEERRVGKSVDLDVGGVIRKKKK